MKPKEFLHTALEVISKQFPQVHIKYAYNNVINTYIVELLPVEEFQNNDALDDAWIPLSFKFRETFPNDEIAFISSDSTLSIECPLFEFNVPSIDFDLISEFFASLSKEELNYSFPSNIPMGAKSIGNSIVAVLKTPKEKINEAVDYDTFYQVAA